MKSHGILEDIGAILGYSATASLVDWFGGGNLYIPAEINENHPIAQVIGMPAATRLVREWGGETLWLPLGYQREQDRRDRMIALLLAAGVGSKAVSNVAGMSESHIQKTRKRLEEMGLMPLILRQAGLENRNEKSKRKAGGGSGNRS